MLMVAHMRGLTCGSSGWTPPRVGHGFFAFQSSYLSARRLRRVSSWKGRNEASWGLAYNVFKCAYPMISICILCVRILRVQSSSVNEKGGGRCCSSTSSPWGKGGFGWTVVVMAGWWDEEEGVLVGALEGGCWEVLGASGLGAGVGECGWPSCGAGELGELS